MKTILPLFALCFAILFTQAIDAAAQDRRNRDLKPRAGDFDFYVLSLSWSPTFCGSPEGARNRDQCGTRRNFNFVVHGLWPQNERGYPDFCATSEPSRVPNSVGEKLFDIMPSMGLIGHQWRKHGVCSGLSQRDYFATLRRAYERVTLPADIVSSSAPKTLSADEVEARFISANPGMTRRGIAATCDNRQLDEVRICMTKDLAFRDCAEVDSRGCRIGNIAIPSAR